MLSNLDKIKELINNNSEIILLFETRWCPICRIQKNDLLDFNNIYNINFYEVDVQDNNDIRDYFQISSTPVIHIYRNGELKIKLIGYHETGEFLQIYQKDEYIENN